ncbi:hypothetical protein [Limosilactobacillus albertensis]|uniref:Gp58-like domain-containing protein n=1 Tax=Limosilactobacillus albertensis TaxID=2759752 RepID=A0A839GYM7_9LACO|nr:hypothetical protein [Limosilactobacillus albertensis]MBB1123283.1 hypothetical protein [Limosilactobacillus albertensis]MCD7121305.1 hypothetical protein [Limosilactobacillus albertensis]
MAENSQLSDEMKSNSTDTSSSDVVSMSIGNHENAIVPHKISNHDKLVQTMVMVDGEWINVNDTNDQANMKYDMHKVNKKVVEAQKGIVEAKNSAESAVKYADSAVSASKVNSDAIVAQSSAISEAKAAADDAASKAQAVKENATSEAAAIRNQVVNVANNVSSVKADIASAASDVSNLKVSVQANSAAIVKTNDAVKVQSKNSSDAINELKIANGQVESIAKDAQNNATVAKQTADAATTVAQDAKSNAVVAKQTATSATIEATNATSTATKAELSMNGLTTRVDGIEGDTKKLSGRVVSTETILQQTKDQLLQKADKSVINQAQNLINQLSAEQKVMAGQIEQKASSSEYQTLKDKVNGLNGGGRNLLKGTRDFNSKYWYQSGYNTALADNPADQSTKEIHSWQDWHSFKNNQVIQLDPNKNYMVSADIAIYSGNGSGLEITAYGVLDGTGLALTDDVDLTGFPKQSNNEGFRRVYLPLKKKGRKLETFRIEGHGNWNAGSGSVFIAKISLYEGNNKQAWEDSTDDFIENIQKNSTAIDENSKAIKLKADSTEVNNLKGMVNSHSASINLFSNQLKSMVTESKVNDIINGKGFATQSYTQSIVNQKAGQLSETITQLDTTFKTGMENSVQLVRKSDFEDGSKGNWTVHAVVSATNPAPPAELGQSGMKVLQTNTRDGYENGIWYSVKPGEKFDVDYWCAPSPVFHTTFGLVFVDKDKANWNWQGIGSDQSGQWKHYTGTITAPANAAFAKPWYQMEKPVNNTENSSWIAKPSIRRQNASTVSAIQDVQASIDGLQSVVKNKVDQSQYTQLAGVVQTKVSQSDFNRLNNQVNVQTLDSANINDMKMTGHYFVRNLTGNPIGGWVYVDVTGNANNRIRQDVYQDSGTKHAFRRWFGNYWTGWSTGVEESEITQLRDAVNLRVKSGELLSQINLEAGRQLFQAKKIYFDADSFVLGPQAKAFIPSAYITNLSADKINTGTLHSISINNGNGKFTVDSNGNVVANSIHVNNGSIYQGQILGADLYSISNLASNSLNSVNDATQNWVKLKNGTIELHGANGNHYSSIMPVDMSTAWNNGSAEEHHGLGILDSEEVIIGQAALYSDNNHRITHNTNLSMINRTNLTISSSVIQATLAPDWGDGKGALFSIQKDNKIGAYFGSGDHGNELNITTAGDGNRIHFIANNFDINSEVNIQNHGLTVRDLHVTNWLGVDGSKNSVVKTSQGTVAINAYETAEYYFGDIGEGQTNSNGIAYIGIEKLFNELINTNIPYQVFLATYGEGKLWVEKRECDRFMVKSDQPNVKFGWEIKAKRKGYEHTRLQNVDSKLNHMKATS